MFSEDSKKESDYLRWIADRLEHLRSEKLRPVEVREIANRIDLNIITLNDVGILEGVYFDMLHNYKDHGSLTYMKRLKELYADLGSMCKANYASNNLKDWRLIHKVTLKFKKPPLGLSPRKVADRNRADQIVEAMLRYAELEMKIPYSWVQELKERLK